MDDLQNSKGQPTGIEYGFLRIMEMLEREYDGAELIVCWDCPTATDKRRKIAPYYKESRRKKRAEAEAEEQRELRAIPGRDGRTFYDRVRELRESMLSCRWQWCEVKGLEADDLMHTLAKTNPDGVSYIYTNDRDLLQSVVDDTIIMVKSRHSKRWEWNEEKIWKEFRVRPWQLPLYRAVIGDPRDDIPGFGKLGKEKTAEYVRAAVRAWNKNPSSGSWTDVLCDLIKKDRHRYTDKVWDAWTIFSKEYLDSNFLVSSLTVIDGVTVTPPTGNVELQKGFLLANEINTLNLCRELLAADFKEEEF